MTCRILTNRICETKSIKEKYCIPAEMVPRHILGFVFVVMMMLHGTKGSHSFVPTKIDNRSVNAFVSLGTDVPTAMPTATTPTDFAEVIALRAMYVALRGGDWDWKNRDWKNRDSNRNIWDFSGNLSDGALCAAKFAEPKIESHQ